MVEDESRAWEGGSYCCLIRQLVLLIKQVAHRIISMSQRSVDPPVCQFFKLNLWSTG